MRQSNRLIFAVVAFCFFISGMAGLIYQIAWMRYLALFLGHTSYAVVAVLVAFMGGLAAGNALFGAWADKAKKPLALYAWLEFGIALYALLFPAYYTLCHDAYVSLAKQWQPFGASALGLKFAFSFAAIILPTMLMGATLPVLARFVTRSLAELRGKVAALYAVNSAGAVIGCVVADFWWIPAFGLEFTVFGAGALNFLAGLTALSVSARIGEGASAASETTPATASPSEQFTNAELRWAIWAIGVSGFVAMLYEVAWTRLLALALGSSTHAFSLMLITFIAGIAVGAWIVYRWTSLRHSLNAFAWAELALAVVVFVSMFFYESLPFWFLKLAYLLARKSAAYPLYELCQALICFAVMFVPAVCLGLTLPLVSRIATVEVSKTGRSVGKVFAVNTLGTVVGSVMTGLWLMPALGLARTFAFGVALNALIGAGILLRDRLTIRHAFPALAATGVFVWIAGVLFSQHWQSTFSLGLWRNDDFAMTRSEFRDTARSRKVKFARDGAGATVVVSSWRNGQTENLTLSVNGKVDASTTGDMPTQLFLGHLPLLLHSNATQVLVVGLGSGVTAAAAASHASVQRVDAVEISRDVVEAARLFHSSNSRVHENPRVRIVVDDAKSFLQTTPHRYDVITSEPSNPWMAGVASVFTREFYESCRDRLQTNGLMVQWVQVYEIDDETLNLVLRTFSSVFPFVNVWQPIASDLLLVGSTQPFASDLAKVLQRLEEPGVKSDLAQIEIDRPVAFFARELVSWRNGSWLTSPDGPTHRDAFPELEYRAQKAFFIRKTAEQWRRLDENYRPRAATLLGDYLKSHPLTEADCKTLVRYCLSYEVPDAQIISSLLHRWRQDFPNSTLPLEIATKLPDRSVPAELEAQRYRPIRDRLMQQAQTDPEPLRLYAGFLLRANRAQRSVFFNPPSEELELILKRLIETDSANQAVYLLYQAELAWDRGDNDECMRLGMEGIARGKKDFPHEFRIDTSAPVPLLWRMLDSLLRAQRLKEAHELAQYAVANGYVNSDPALAAICRKVQAAAAP